MSATAAGERSRALAWIRKWAVECSEKAVSGDYTVLERRAYLLRAHTMRDIADGLLVGSHWHDAGKPDPI